MSAIPSDNYIRLMLDGAPSAAFDGLLHGDRGGRAADAVPMPGPAGAITLDGTDPRPAQDQMRALFDTPARGRRHGMLHAFLGATMSHRAISRRCHCRRKFTARAAAPSSPPQTRRLPTVLDDGAPCPPLAAKACGVETWASSLPKPGTFPAACSCVRQAVQKQFPGRE